MPWPEVVRRISAIREENPLTALSSGHALDAAGVGNPAMAKLDAHDIANRIMRQENYLIALFNKELLDLRVPLPVPVRRMLAPVLGSLAAEEDGKGRMLTRALEWNLRFCLMEYLFDPSGRVRKLFLKSKNRAVLIDGYGNHACELGPGSSSRTDFDDASFLWAFSM
jgi:autophagy-related protein 9